MAPFQTVECAPCGCAASPSSVMGLSGGRETIGLGTLECHPSCGEVQGGGGRRKDPELNCVSRGERGETSDISPGFEEGGGQRGGRQLWGEGKQGFGNPEVLWVVDLQLSILCPDLLPSLQQPLKWTPAAA